MFTVMPIIIIIGFILVFGGILYAAVKHFRNASAPQESAYARIVTSGWMFKATPIIIIMKIKSAIRVLLPARIITSHLSSITARARNI